MTIDPTIYTRQKVIAALKADATLTAIVPAARIYPQKTPDQPTFPFIRMGALSFQPLRGDGGAGGQATGAVHCFTKASASTPDAEAQAASIQRRMAEVIDAINDMDVNNLQLSIHVTGGQLLMDAAEADCFHGLVNFDAVAT
jgi:hypothetical protein